MWGDVLERPDFASDIDHRPEKFAPESGDLLELPDFAYDYDNCFYDAQCDVDSPDYSDCDEPGDLDGYSDVYGFVGTDDYYAPTDVDFMHEFHGPDNCGMYCLLRYEIRPYGHYAPTDVEFYHGMHSPENCGEKCVTQSDGESDICAICDIGDICEKAVSGVPEVPHGSENCRAKCVTRRNAGESGDTTSDSCHTDMCTSLPGFGGFGDIQFVYMNAPGSDAAGVGNRSFSETPVFASDHDRGPGKPSLGSGDVLGMPDCVSVIDTGPGKPSPESC